MIGTVGFVGARLAEALQARGISAVALARMLGVTPMAVSQYVSGKTSPRPEAMKAICVALSLPEAYFRKPTQNCGDEDQEVFWRSFSSATKTSRLQAGWYFRWLKEITAYLGGFFDFPRVNLPRISAPSDISLIRSADIERMAEELRKHWSLGVDPISDVVLLLENNGVIVARHTMGTAALDAFSQWSKADNLPYVVLGTDKDSSVRARNNAAHEAAHLHLHSHLNAATIRTPALHKELERQAFRFAAAFLLPAEPFLNDLWAPTLEAFRALKDRWKVAIGLMIKRCEDLGVVSEEQARRLWINYNRKGWRKWEPLDDSLTVERPRLLRRSVELLLREGGKNKLSILGDLKLSALDVEELCELPAGFFSDDYEPVAVMPQLRTQSATKQDSPGTVIPFSKRN